MADHTPLPAGTVPSDTTPPGAFEDGAKHTARRVNVRVFIYVIGLHVFAGFAMLLFYAAQHRS